VTVPQSTGLSEERQDVIYSRLASVEMLEVESQKQGEEREAPWQGERRKRSSERDKDCSAGFRTEALTRPQLPLPLGAFPSRHPF
jgi:hypothetical protein